MGFWIYFSANQANGPLLMGSAGPLAQTTTATLGVARFQEFLNASHRFDKSKGWALFKDYKVPEEWGGMHPKWVRVFSQGFIMREK
jgi:hypothetical protein